MMKRINQFLLGVVGIGFLIPVLSADLTCDIEAGTYSGGSSFSIENIKYGHQSKVIHFKILPDVNKKVALKCSCKMNKKHPNKSGFTACIWTLKDKSTHEHKITSDNSPKSIELSVKGSSLKMGFFGGFDN